MLQIYSLGSQNCKKQEDATAGPASGGGQSVVPPLGPLPVRIDACSLPWFEELGSSFEKDVLLVLHDILVQNGGACGAAPKFNLKGDERAYAKALVDYGKDFRLLKDMLRGSIVCRDLNQLRRVWDEMEKLQKNGVLTIVQIKNRFRGEPFPTGYRDLNCNVEFQGFICEIQVHCEAHYDLKDEQHVVYQLLRSLRLMGDMKKEQVAPDANVVRPLLWKRVAASVLRFMAFIYIAGCGWTYGTLSICFSAF